jgi:hypothetical protein
MSHIGRLSYDLFSVAIGKILGIRASSGSARGAFEPTRLVWSRGLALMCEHNGGMQFVREQRGGGSALRFDPQAYDKVRDGELVWVRVSALPQFVEEVLPRVRAHFALVTGDEDWSIPSDFDRATDIISNEHVACWFTQNFDGNVRGRKILPLPIGLDFHTISNGHRWGHSVATPGEQEEELELIRGTMPANMYRELRVHADFHFNKQGRAIGGESRHSVEAILRRNSCVEFQRNKISRLKLWRVKTRYAFAVSPHGNGLDCHRTWESLALNNIVIVKHSPLDSLYEGLPVAILDHWEDISEANLRRWQRQYSGLFVQPEVQKRLTNQYWIDRIRQVLTERLARPLTAAL